MQKTMLSVENNTENQERTHLLKSNNMENQERTNLLKSNEIKCRNCHKKYKEHFTKRTRTFNIFRNETY